MKKLTLKVVMSLSSILPIQGMERPPLSPLKTQKGGTVDHAKVRLSRRGTKRSLEEQLKENESGTSTVLLPTQVDQEKVVTPNGKALRRKIATGVKRCVAAPSGSADLDTLDDLSPAALTLSPQSLTKELYARSLSAAQAQCRLLGATDARIKTKFHDSCKAVAAQADKRKRAARRPDWQEENRFKRVARLFQVPHYELRYDSAVHSAVSEGSVVVANESAMARLTALQRCAVYAHEITHGKNDDWAVRNAYHAEFMAQGKLSEYQAEIEQVLFRTQEVFADLIPAAKAAILAKGITEYRQDILKSRGPGAPSTHPANKDWAELDELMVKFHQKHSEEKERKERKERMTHLAQKLRGLEEKK